MTEVSSHTEIELQENSRQFVLNWINKMPKNATFTGTLEVDWNYDLDSPQEITKQTELETEVTYDESTSEAVDPADQLPVGVIHNLSMRDAIIKWSREQINKIAELIECESCGAKSSVPCHRMGELANIQTLKYAHRSRYLSACVMVRNGEINV